jgi:hypothetical protein
MDILRRHVTSKSLLQFRRQSLLNKPINPSTLLRVGLLQILSCPHFQVGSGFWPRVFLARSHCVQLRKSYSKRHVVDVVFSDHIVSCNRQRRQLQQLEKSFTRETPAFLVPLCKSFRVCQGFCEGNNGCLAVQWPGKLLRFREDYIEIDGCE